MTHIDERNGLTNPAEYHAHVTNRIERSVHWTHPGLRIDRLRLLSDRGHPEWDVSYCHGFIGDEPVRVTLPFDRLPKRQWSRAIVEHAQRDGVFAKGLGIFDAISTLQ